MMLSRFRAHTHDVVGNATLHLPEDREQRIGLGEGADHILRVLTPSRVTLPAQVALPRGAFLAATPRALQQALRDGGTASARADQAIHLETGDPA